MTEPCHANEAFSPDPAAGLENLAVSWVDLIEISSTDRVLLVDAAAGRAEPDLRARSAHVTVIQSGQVPPDAGFDVICVDGARLSRGRRSSLATSLAADGRWVQVSDNALSPLRMVDRARGRPAGSDRRFSLRLLRRSLARDVGGSVDQVFVLLRSTARPITAFDALSRTGMGHTIAASLTHIGGLRGVLLRLARWLPPSVVAPAAPGWLLVTRRDTREPDLGRVVGKVANNDSDEVKIMRGDPPVVLEKRFVLSTPSAEVAALQELALRGFHLAPQLLEADDTTLRYRWRNGSTLPLARLDEDELTTWIGRAAEVLMALQTATVDDAGTVLVHGDYWLGNLLVEDDRVCCVLDWTDSHRGSPDIDRRFLVSSLEGKRTLSPALLARLEQVIDRAFA